MAETVNRQTYEIAWQVPTKAELLFILTFCWAWPHARMAPHFIAPSPDTHALSLSLIKFSLCKCQCTKTHRTTSEGLSTGRWKVFFRNENE